MCRVEGLGCGRQRGCKMGLRQGKMRERLHAALQGSFWRPGSPGHGEAQPVPDGRRCPELTPPYPTPNMSLHGSQSSPISLPPARGHGALSLPALCPSAFSCRGRCPQLQAAGYGLQQPHPPPQ